MSGVVAAAVELAAAHDGVGSIPPAGGRRWVRSALALGILLAGVGPIRADAQRSRPNAGEDQRSDPASDDWTLDEGEDSSPTGAGSGNGPGWEDRGSEESEPAPGTEARLGAWLSVGLGAAQRAVDYASVEGIRSLDTSLVPAAVVRARGALTDGSLLFDVGLSYQTSLWAEGHQAAPAGLGNVTPIRSHRFEGGVAPGLRLGRMFEVSLFGGYSLRSFASVEHLVMPSFTLHGPVVRLSLQLSLANLVQIRLAPELQVLLGVGEELRAAGNLDSGGTALGFEAELTAMITSWLGVELSYREAHASVGSHWAQPFTDVERYAVLAARFKYY